ncbi:MAG TPA: FAD-dependent oxidoreductase, partial [Stellaceae bacterium]|nr:FAD-dependent oxidoreductase [Stellaceae bacterium]
RLAQAGAAVTVLEATRVGGGTSGISFAWTNAHKKPPKPYHDLNVAGMRAHPELADEFGATPWWHGGGSLEWEAEPDRSAQGENIEQLRSWGYAAEWITPRQVQELEPDVNPATIGDAPVAFFPEEGWLDPVVYAHAMLSAARLRHGAKVICGARVVDLIMAGDRVTGVRIADGARYEADTVVNCAGRWTNEATRDAGLHLPLAPTVGFLVFTPPVAASLSRVVRTTVIDARPDGAGRLILHWNPTARVVVFLTPTTWARRPAYHLFRTGRARAEPRAGAHLPTFRQAIPAMTRFQARCRGLWSCRSGRTGEVQRSKGRDRPARCSGTFSGSYGPSLYAPPLPPLRNYEPPSRGRYRRRR